MSVNALFLAWVNWIMNLITSRCEVSLSACYILLPPYVTFPLNFSVVSIMISCKQCSQILSCIVSYFNCLLRTTQIIDHTKRKKKPKHFEIYRLSEYIAAINTSLGGWRHLGRHILNIYKNVSNCDIVFNTLAYMK